MWIVSTIANIMDIRIEYLTIIPRALMGSESIAHEAVGRMGYLLSICFPKPALFATNGL